MQDATKYYRNGIARFTRRTNCLFTRHLHAYRQSYWGKSYKFTCFFSYIMYICVCEREMSCCFFYALHNTLWITEQHAIETRGLISISQAFWIEIPTKKRRMSLCFRRLLWFIWAGGTEMDTVSGVSNSVSGDIQNASAGKKTRKKLCVFAIVLCKASHIFRWDRMDRWM